MDNGGSRSIAPALTVTQARDIAHRLAGLVQELSVENSPDALRAPIAALQAAAQEYEAASAALEPLRIILSTSMNSPACGLIPFFDSQSFAITPCFDATDFLQSAISAKPGLVILDIDQPGAKGLVLLRYLRSLPNTPPLLAVTEHSGGLDLRMTDLSCPPLVLDGITQQSVFAAIAAVLQGPRLIPSADVDEKMFQQLMALAKESGRIELFNRITSDLTNASDRLENCNSLDHIDDIRGVSHMLIALGGAAGGIRLQHQSEALNLASHEPANAELVPVLLTAVKDSLKRFLDFLGSQADILK